MIAMIKETFSCLLFRFKKRIIVLVFQLQLLQQQYVFFLLYIIKLYKIYNY